ncbi:erythromycin esterase family protein [Paenibacillus sp. BR2-3]|uniref:erythromycin esterase family protein n=1 Tax=Paenibacillus sp. BR2-3 TaxID=3048494 RepID=UPI003977ABB3
MEEIIWGAPLEKMRVPQAATNSWEELLHRDGAEDKLLFFDTEEPVLDETVIGHRAIGVVYHPEWERGNYVSTVISKRYDAFIYIDKTNAVSPLAVETVQV